ncbi:MAG: AraC family transcriptional regulator [Hyphomonadaceae bacterium]|nr:AraC family transcriptional regulator [Hyphomonadaceae bacterium]
MTPALPSQLEAAAEISRHAHVGAYATVVLEGAYEEAGDAGRFRVRPGDVLVHAPFSAHRDLVARARTLVLDLALPFDGRDWRARGRVADPDAIVRVAQRDPREAAARLIEAFEPLADSEADLPDLLARDLSDDPSLAIASWARAKGVSRETAWRHFRAAYDVDIAAYRGEARARRAWRMIVASRAALAEIAAATGFSDQPHMSRAVKALTGHTPGKWRRHVATSVQDGRRAAG